MQTIGVLIVGAGPAGLTVANQLARMGYRDIRIIDAATNFGEGGRGVNLWARTQEIAHMLGAHERLASVSLKTTGSHITAYDNYVGFQPFNLCASRFPEVLSLVQSELHRGLGDTLVQLGVPIEFNVKLTHLRAQDSGTIAILHHKDGSEETVRARYVVGADGGRSAVRRCLNIELQEHDIVDARIHQMDGQFTWSSPTLPSEWSLFIRPNGQSGIVPLPNGVTRVFICEALSDAMEPRIVSAEEMTERLRIVTGDPGACICNPVWASWGRLTAGIIERFRVGDVFFVGDAAHKVIPVGGQGANQALHDGFNLGWKLGSVLLGRLQDWVLDTYHDERHSIRTQLAIEQAQSFQRMIEPSAEQVERTKQMAQDFARQSSRGTDLPQRDLQMLDINYPASRLSEDHLADGTPAGDRTPDAIVVDLMLDRRTGWFSDLLRHSGWTLLGLDAGDSQAGKTMVAAFQDQSRRYQGLPYRLCVGAMADAANHSVGTPILLDVQRRLHKAFAIEAPAIIAIRPDGHIGFRAPAADVDKLAAYLSRVLIART